jgi:hypothetical protein
MHRSLDPPHESRRACQITLLHIGGERPFQLHGIMPLGDPPGCELLYMIRWGKGGRGVSHCWELGVRVSTKYIFTVTAFAVTASSPRL